MNLVEACLKGDESETVNALENMIPKAQPPAIWAILMHAASWHEQRTYDTPHSTILTYAIHRMIEDLGPHERIVPAVPRRSLAIPTDLKEHLQMALIERLALHLAAVDHWLPEKGPRYDVRSGVDSPSNMLRKFTQSIRERSILGAMEGAIGLSSQEETFRLKRMIASMAAERPDQLGHGFIMPISLATELPPYKYRHPNMAALWHLAEYMIRKVPSKKPEGFIEDEQFKRPADKTDLSKDASVFGTALVEYGILGHNGILAHRIAYASEEGLIHNATVRWLLEVLRTNMKGKPCSSANLEVAKLIKSNQAVDWEQQPSEISVPNTKPTKEWLSSNMGDVWKAMTDLKGNSFESMLSNLSEKEWDAVRAAQYAVSALYGRPKSSHIMIFTQSAWGLVDYGIVSRDLAALQVHRMVREYLRGR